MNESKRTASILEKTTRLRWLVALLGSKNQFAWWDCAFMDDVGIRFLSTTFPRSAHSAAFHATTETAQRVHDEALGRIGTYHLFRLPVSVEDRLEADLQIPESLNSKGEAMSELKELADAFIIAPSGPIQVGVERRIMSQTSIQEMAAHYHSAFNRGTLRRKMSSAISSMPIQRFPHRSMRVWRWREEKY